MDRGTCQSIYFADDNRPFHRTILYCYIAGAIAYCPGCHTPTRRVLRAWPAEKWISHPKVVSREPLRIRTRNLEGRTRTLLYCTRRTKKHILKIMDIFIFRHDLDEWKLKKRQLLSISFATNSYLPTENSVGQTLS